VGAPSGQDALGRIGDAFETTGIALLVLDHVEPVWEHAKVAVDRWLRMAAELRILVVSRQRLDMPGEALFDLGPLSLPQPGHAVGESEAVQLFVDRVRAVRRDYELTDDEATTVASLVRHLDGLPLAIELAAARVRVLSPAQILENLHRRFQLLSKEHSDHASRRATMKEAVNWSWQLLNEWEQAALSQCSVFRGGFDLAAAEEVIDLEEYADAPWVLDVLQSLRDKSLLTNYEPERLPGQRRFTMYFSVRQFSAERLEETGRAMDVLDRHAAYFLRAAEEWVPTSDASDEALRRLSVERENLLAVYRRSFDPCTMTGPVRIGSSGPVLPPNLATQALRAALALAPVLASEGPLGLGHSLLRAALTWSEPPHVDEALYARALEARGMMRRRMGDADDSLADCERAREIAERIGQPTILAAAHEGLGWLCITQGRSAEARAHHERVLAIHHARGDRRSEGRSWAAIGDSAMWCADGIRPYEEALTLHRSEGDRTYEAYSLAKLAGSLLSANRHDEARKAAEQAQALAREIGEPQSRALAIAVLGLADYDQGRLEDAQLRLERALSLQRGERGRWAKPAVLMHVAGLQVELGDTADARGPLEEARRLARDLRSIPLEALALGRLAVVDVLTGELTRAESNMQRAEDLASKVTEIGLTTAVTCLRRVLDPGTPPPDPREHERQSARSFELRLSCRLVEAANRRREGGVSEATPCGEEALWVCESGRWFQPPRKDRVSLQRRRALPHVLARLIDVRLSSPGVALSVSDLLEYGWPGERVQPEAGADRVYMALSTLRKLGLRSALLSRDDGYLIDPTLPVRRVPVPT